MDNYIVSARKYRPMTFDTVVGQEALTATLKNSILTGRLAHAYLFCGPRGVGKTTCARIFAKTINCMSLKENGEACGECESCKAFEEQRSLNIYELDAASNNSVEDIRTLIEQTRIPPQIGKYKVFIVDEVHMLSTNAFNAFLKTLEEPPQHVVFILATTEKHKLLPTILSRCQIYDFNRMNVPDIVNHLKKVAENEGIKAEEAALGVIADKADGGMRDALSIFDQVAAFCQGNITYQQTIANLNVLDYAYYFRLVDLFLANKVPEIMTTFNEVLCKGFPADHFMNGLNAHFRNLLMSRDVQTLPLIQANEDVRQKYGEQAKRCKPQFLYSAIRRCTDCDISYKQSQNRRLLVEITLIEIAQDAQEDAPSAGRRPAKKLNPIFKVAAKSQTVAAQQSVSSNGPAASGSAKANTASSATNSPSQSGASSTIKSQGSNAATGNNGAKGIDWSRIQPTQTNAKPFLGSVSIKGAMQGTTTSASQPSATGQNSASTSTPPQFDASVFPQQKEEFNEINVIVALKIFAEQKLQNNKPMASKMSRLNLTVNNEHSATIVAENPIVQNQLGQIINPVNAFLKRYFQDDSVKIDIKLQPPTQRARVLTPQEQYDKILKKSPALKNLAKELQLHL